MIKHKIVFLTIFVSVLFLSFSNICPVSADSEIIVSRGENFVISITLLQNGSYGDPVPYQPVYFFDQTYDTYLGSAFTDINGQALLEHAFSYNHTLGLTLINVTYRGNLSLALAPSCQWIQILVVSSSVIELQVSDSSLSPGDSLDFNALLKDDSNLPIQDAPLAVYSNDKLLVILRTNSSGYVEFSINCNSTWYLLGQNTIHVIYEGNLNSYRRATLESFTIDVTQIQTSILAVDIPQDTLRLNQTVEITVIGFFDTELMIFTQLDLYIDDTKLMDVTTNETGYAEVKIHLDEHFKLGENRLQIVFPGSERYSSTVLEEILYINSSAVLAISVDDLVVIGEFADISVNLHDDLDRSITNATITLIDTQSGQHYNPILVVNSSIYEFRILIEGDKGERNFLIDLSRNPFLLNSSQYFPIIVWSQPSLVAVRSNIFGYASPLQSVTFEILLFDNDGNLSDCIIGAHSSTNETNLTYVTNTKGTTIISIIGSDEEGIQYLYVNYNGSVLEYLLPDEIQIVFSVQKVLPVRITLLDYSVINSLKSLSVRLSTIVLNGTLLDGVLLTYFWLTSQGQSLSEMGFVTFILQIPSSAGIYTLTYEIQEQNGILSSNGEILIIIDNLDANAGEGIGILGITAGLASSLSIPIIAIMRRRYIIG